MNQGDSAAIRMTDEEGLGHVQGFQQCGQNLKGFPVHVIGRETA
jgi:hypothetical protein